MKPLHLSCDLKNEIRPCLQHFQVREGKVYATTTWAAVRMDAKYVFGENPPITEDEVLYFHGADWQKAKMHKAVQITRDGLFFTGLDKKGALVGTVKAKTELGPTDGAFPDIDIVFIEKQTPLVAVTRISFNAQMLADLVESFAADPIEDGHAYLEFHGMHKGIMVRFTKADFEGILMPTNVAPEVCRNEEEQARYDFRTLWLTENGWSQDLELKQWRKEGFDHINEETLRHCSDERFNELIRGSAEVSNDEDDWLQ
jgi:hypothetical protein